MRKTGFYLLALVLVGAAAAAIVFAAKSSKSHVDTTAPASSSVSPKKTTKRACTIFTLADAKDLIGDTAKGGQKPTLESSEDLDVSNCTYTQDQGANAPVSGRQIATLLVRAPKTRQGIISNQNQFGSLRPSGVEDVSGYGDQAFWDPQNGQLNILKNNNWYILSYGSVMPSSRSLAETKQMADVLISKL